MDIVYVIAFAHSAQADLVCLTDGLSALHAAASHPHGEAPRIMIAPGPFLIERRPSELSAPHHQRIFQHAPRFQIGQQSGDRFVRSTAPLAVVALDVIVRIPPAAGTAIELYKTDAALYQPPRHQAVLSVRSRFRIVDAVHILRGRGFAVQIHRFGGGGLHLVCQFVRPYARIQFRIVRALLVVPLIQFLQVRKLAALLFVRYPVRCFQVQNRSVALAELCTLETGRQEPGTPNLGAADRLLIIQENDERRQIPVGAAQAIGEPRAHRRPSRQNVARVHLRNGANVIQSVGPAGADDSQIVHVLRNIRIPIGNPKPALPMLFERSLRCHQRIVRRAHRRNHFAEGRGHRLPVQFLQLRLRIEQIDVAWSALHEEPNDGLRLRRMVRLLRRHRVHRGGSGKRAVLVKQVRQRDTRQAAAGLRKELPPRLHAPMMRKSIQHPAPQSKYRNSFELNSMWHRSTSAAA